MFRRDSSSNTQGPQRGPGGGKIRNRAPQRPRTRRRLRFADFATISIIGAVVVFIVYYKVLNGGLALSIVWALFVGITSPLLNYGLEKWRWRNAPPPAPSRPKRRR